MNPDSEVAEEIVGILTTDYSDFHGFRMHQTGFKFVSVTLSTSVPIREIRGSISVFGMNGTNHQVVVPVPLLDKKLMDS